MEEKKTSHFKGRLRKRGVSVHLTIPMDEIKANKWKKGQLVEAEVTEVK